MTAGAMTGDTSDINSLLGGKVQFSLECLEWELEHIPAELKWMRQHFKITPKPERQHDRAGRPKGSKTDTTSTKAEVDLWTEGLSDHAIYDRLKPSHVFDGGRARRAKIYTFSKEKQARIRAAHKAGKARLKAETRAAARQKKKRKKESGSEFLS